MMKFKDSKLEMHLEAQSPMIHFQANQLGVTIRASEVKPKFDKYILARLMRESNQTLEDLRKSPIYKNMFQASADHRVVASNVALRYKMHIYSDSEPDRINLDDYKIFYGNVGRNDKITAIFSNPCVTILCFQKELQKLIEDYVEGFFLTMNFGTMQGKGFGSFMPVESNLSDLLTLDEEKRIAGYLKAVSGATHCYAIQFTEADNQEREKICPQMFNEIKAFYSIMKSGQNGRGYARSYLYEYAHQHMKENNEKAWLKNTGIAPILCKPQNEHKASLDPELRAKYIKALLGTCATYIYKTAYRVTDGRQVLDNRNQIVIRVEHMNEEGCEKLQRVRSPLFFKIVKNVVFIITNNVPQEVYGQTFCFKREDNQKEGFLTTPEAGSFDIQDFLQRYVAYYNSEEDDPDYYKKGLRVKLNSMKYYQKVVEIDA